MLLQEAVMGDMQQRGRQYHVRDHVPGKQVAIRDINNLNHQQPQPSTTSTINNLNTSFLKYGTPARQPMHLELLHSVGVDWIVMELKTQTQRLQQSRRQ